MQMRKSTEILERSQCCDIAATKSEVDME